MTKPYLGIEIHEEEPTYINEFSKALLDGFYLKPGETISEALARASTGFCYGDYELAQRLYNAAYEGWFMFASPIFSNAPEGLWELSDPSAEWNHKYTFHKREDKNRGMPISCFSIYVGDTIKDQVNVGAELAALSVAGGGVGLHNAIRATTDKAPGPIPYMKVVDGMIGYYRQGKTRRGACAWYMDINHPDIMEHIRFRIPSGGDSARKSDNRKQFHCAVNVTDEFINAVFNDLDFDLVCPHTKEVRETLKARKLWEEILDARSLTGEPYIFKIDTANRALPQTQRELGLKVNGSNICVTPETLILTDKGHIPIGELEDQTVNVWNGEEFSETVIRRTGEDQEVLTVSLSKGQIIECTPGHRFYVVEGYGKSPTVKMASDLLPGERIEKCEFPIIEGSSVLDRAYTNGFYTGDGCKVRNKNRIYLYDTKLDLDANLEGDISWYHQVDPIRKVGTTSGLREKYFVPDCSYSIESRVRWLSGLLDADGTVCVSGKSETLQIGSSNLHFLKEVQLMLQSLGCDPNISLMREGGYYDLPNHKGGNTKYNCKEVNRLLISSYDVYRLVELGMSCNRLRIKGEQPSREARTFNQVVSVKNEFRRSDVFCFTEPKRGRGVFNGVLTGQCIEITLPTNSERTFVCCLSSTNLEKYDDWENTGLIADLTRYLDNVIQYFIDNADESLSKAKYSAMRERALGIGTMGWHYYLQSKGIPFEGGGFGSAIQHTHKIYKKIKEEAVAASLELGVERGEAPDMVGTGRRNSHLLAIAPNSNNAVILGTSPSIEPVSGNIYSHSTRAGTFEVRNPYLQKTLERVAEENGYSKAWIEKQWAQVVADGGSAQGLPCLTEEEKDVFKTAFEMDQHWLLTQADARQEYVCQSQSLNTFFPAGVDAGYFNSVHLYALKLPWLKALYYARMERGINADIVKKIERKALQDWSGEECVACSG